MTESGYRPEGAETFKTKEAPILEGKRPVEDYTEEELRESQDHFARVFGRKDWESMKLLEQAEYWASEGSTPNNYRMAEEVAKRAGLDRKSQLGYIIRATKARVNALAFDSSPDRIEEFHKMDKLQQDFTTELKALQPRK